MDVFSSGINYNVCKVSEYMIFWRVFTEPVVQWGVGGGEQHSQSTKTKTMRWRKSLLFSLILTCQCHNWVQLCLIFIFCQIYKSLGCQKICQNTPASPSCFDKLSGILESCISDKTFTGIIEPNIITLYDGYYHFSNVFDIFPTVFGLLEID